MNEASIEFEEVENVQENSKFFYYFTKRIFDIAVSFIALVICMPLFLIVAICIKIDSKGSAFLVQKRIGKYGKEFNFYKFRSMVLDADKKLYELLDENEERKKEYAKNKKLKNDPRITKVGRIIRRLSIDELPQLLNVLKGDMSLIGNRPYLPREKKDMGKYYKDIVKTKPGITGYWQVSGRKDATFKKRLELESYYSNNCSVKMDIKIFFKTFGAIIGGHGAEE